jgi:hypothetical protein
MKHKQRGMTLIGFIISLSIAGLFIYVGMKLIPMYTEFYSVKKALSSLEAEPGLASKGPPKIEELFFKRLYMSYAAGIKKENVKIERFEAGYKVIVDYESRREMIANLDVVGKFHAEKVIERRAGE